MKAILVIDEMPNTCLDCPLNGYENVCNVTLEDNYDYLTEKPTWCPLKSLPKKKNTDFHPNVVYANGWNDCLKEIKGD